MLMGDPLPLHDPARDCTYAAMLVQCMGCCMHKQGLPSSTVVRSPAQSDHPGLTWGSLTKRLRQSTKLVPLKGSPPMPTTVLWPRPSSVVW